ncbi:ABZJ_00895 family protein [Thioclava pacifica]|uniref:Uncharacterized protein n=1 Tax=Thioclava pacifica DSM 10166 TaxID=1353537 RepID=A0A074JEB4_9RHOB|nr:ABZJ_00895 family protein [Thioclava pacifica]KEO54165.1 hypothetical protein TP2_04390 [Thioclava pacifica DSM 10166]
MRTIYLTYLAWFIGLTIGLPLVLMAIEAVTGFDIISSAVSIIPSMIAAHLSGSSFVKRFGRGPEKPESWRFTIIAFGLLVLTTLALTAGFLVVFPDLQSEMAGMMDPGVFAIFAAMMAVILLVLFFTTRIFFGLGARTQLKALARQSEQG